MDLVRGSHISRLCSRVVYEVRGSLEFSRPPALQQTHCHVVFDAREGCVGCRGSVQIRSAARRAMYPIGINAA
jgi:hypothetical protein